MPVNLLLTFFSHTIGFNGEIGFRIMNPRERAKMLPPKKEIESQLDAVVASAKAKKEPYQGKMALSHLLEALRDIYRLSYTSMAKLLGMSRENYRRNYVEKGMFPANEARVRSMADRLPYLRQDQKDTVYETCVDAKKARDEHGIKSSEERREAVERVFSNLQHYTGVRGWGTMLSDLMQANNISESGFDGINQSTVSDYINGNAFPRKPRLDIVIKTLGLNPGQEKEFRNVYERSKEARDKATQERVNGKHKKPLEKAWLKKRMFERAAAGAERYSGIEGFGHLLEDLRTKVFSPMERSELGYWTTVKKHEDAVVLPRVPKLQEYAEKFELSENEAAIFRRVRDNSRKLWLQKRKEERQQAPSTELSDVEKHSKAKSVVQRG